MVDPELHALVYACIHEVIKALRPGYAEALRQVELKEAPLDQYARQQGITPTTRLCASTGAARLWPQAAPRCAASAPPKVAWIATTSIDPPGKGDFAGLRRNAILACKIPRVPASAGVKRRKTPPRSGRCADGTHLAPPTHLALGAAAHCLTGCSIGEVLDLLIGAALHWSNGATIALASVFGYALTLLPLVQVDLSF